MEAETKYTVLMFIRSTVLYSVQYKLCFDNAITKKRKNRVLALIGIMATSARKHSYHSYHERQAGSIL